MILELKKEKQEKAQSSVFFAQNTKEEISKLDEKLEKLMTAYLENALSLEEYRESKNKLINQKQVLKDKSKAFEQKSNNRFELATKFIQASKEAKIIALQENPERIRDFLKKIGSNFRIAEQTLNFDFKNAWKILDNFNLSARSLPTGQAGAEATIAPNLNFEFLRRVRDSNPRCLLQHTCFPSKRTRPLCELSFFGLYKISSI